MSLHQSPPEPGASHVPGNHHCLTATGAHILAVSAGYRREELMTAPGAVLKGWLEVSAKIKETKVETFKSILKVTFTQLN